MLNKGNMLKKRINSPTLLLIFNRPKTTREVFKEIKKAKPKKLFIAADGPRSEIESDVVKCQNARRVTEDVDWDCEVYRLYREKNLGCKRAVGFAIDWFFKHVDQGIILEDDCKPAQSFFKFMEELLEKYRDNENIMHISGYSHFPENDSKYSYHFSRYTGIWGWATWKRAWEKYDRDLETIPKVINEGKFDDFYETGEEKNHRLKILKKVKQEKIDTWDYQWDYSIRLHDGLCIRPNINLVTNIGMGKGATHTLFWNPKITNNKGKEMEFPLKHPKDIEIDEKKDRQFFEKRLKGGAVRRLGKKILDFAKQI